MFDSLDATATSFPTPTSLPPGRSPLGGVAEPARPRGANPAGPSTLPEVASLPADIESWPTDHRLARILDSIDPMTLSDGDRVRYVQAAERLVAHHQAQTLAGITAVADSYRRLELDDAEHAYDGTVFELRAALSWTRRYAETELDLASDLLIRLPRVLEALSAGWIDRRNAKIIVSDTSHLSIAHARQVANHILSDAERLTTGQLRARIRRAAIDTDPDSVRQQQKKAVADRQFTSWTEPDGTIAIQITGIDPLRGQELINRINRIARQMNGAGELRSMDQLRADIAIGLLTGTEHPTIGTVHFTVHPERPANPAAVTLAGYGPVLPDLLANLDHARKTPTSTAHPAPGTDGHTGRRPTAAQTRQVRANHPTCIGPGCRMPAIDCDLDHTTPYAHTRWTESAGLAPLCRKDHSIRHKAGWRYTVGADRTITWHSPIGTTYTTNNRDP